MVLAIRKGSKQKDAERQQILDQERELYERMEQIELFPGTIEEYESMKGQSYEVIDVPGNRKLVEGGYREWKELNKEEPIPPSIRLPILGWGITIGFYPRTFYHAIRAQAVELGAEAVVRYEQKFSFGIPSYESGIPVRRKIT